MGNYNMKFSDSWGHCQSKEKMWTMNLCELKGAQDVRVSFSSLKQLPKACFRISAEPFMPGKNKMDIFEAALSAHDCNRITKRQKLDANIRRGKFAPTPTLLPLTLATPTTTSMIATNTRITTTTAITTASYAVDARVTTTTTTTSITTTALTTTTITTT